jgi:hypothetical protein
LAHDIDSAIAILSTWRDIGAAVGPLSVGLLASMFSMEAIYAPLAVFTFVMVLVGCMPLARRSEPV